MIFKVLYQESPDEIPVRERTKSMYIEAESVREVRTKLIEKGYKINVEHIHALDPEHLEYEKQSEHFQLENV
ncbi:DNA-dependent RNA polymerase subunit epsilon [Oceanobacillus sp. Castelsardo]|uniref:DNA-dependent RNA polymerase subunit epsilon n=1 Tax=Oceanobacillus sp. Castelsardo TaxID=1851204 RepID=UPI0008396430|nr:RNA polymerase epsilon subunit [Oceanobacillus sp. Castelsardo]